MSYKARIALITRSLDLGGSERQLIELAKHLNTESFESKVFCLYSGGKLSDELLKNNIKYFSAHKRGRWDIIFPLFRLYSDLIRFNPIIVHSFLTIPNLLMVMMKCLRPSINLVWGIRSSFMDLSKYDFVAQLSSILERGLGNIPDAIIANSEASRGEYGFSKRNSNRIIVVPNAIDTQRFSPDPVARKEVREELQIGHSQVVIGMVARIDPMKDHLNFFEAVRISNINDANFKFLCIGGGEFEYVRFLQKTCDGMGLSNIQWLGERMDVERIYNALDIHSLTSLGEGFPNTVAESMASGVPNVATDVGDIAHIIGNTGALIPVGDPEGLARAWGEMKKKLKINKEVVTQASRRRICQNFSAEGITVNLEQIYSELISGK